MEQQLRQAEKLSALGQLVAGVADELNNPLAVVMGYAQILAKTKELSEKGRNELIRIVHESDRAAKIVRNLLTFARMREPDLGVVDLNRLVSNVLDIHETQLSAGKIQVERHLAPNLPLTKADASQIEQVITNLLTNAIQAVGAHEGPRKIALYTEENGLFLRIAVADSGPGIRSEVISKIFDPFFTTKAPGKGTGLGLSICYSIVQEHRGRIWVQSEQGKGATFFVELPIIACLPAELQAPESTDETVLAPSRARRRLLIVDDEPGIVEVLKEILDGNGYEVDTATNGVEAMDRIETGTYDLIISDLSMPEMNGEKLYDTLRQLHPQLAHRVIFVTGDTVSPKAREFLDGVGSRWLSKPFNISEIERLVGNFLSDQPAQVRAAALPSLR
jgi:two-component system NtrC family sensor kinase